MEEPVESGHAQRLHAVRREAFGLVEHLQALVSSEHQERAPLLRDLIGQVQAVVKFVEGETDPAASHKKHVEPTLRQRQEFGKLLRDKRNAAGMSRGQLARKAKLSDSTIKFVETSRHPPSRATLSKLIGVQELKLGWEDAPGASSPPAAERTMVVDKLPVASELNCLLTLTTNPVRMVMELGRFLNGAGGHVEQTNAYLDYQSAATYMAMCQQSAVTAGLRASIPLAEAASRIGAASGPGGLHVIALGAGAATLEVRLVQHLIEQARVPSVDLCLLDISQPLLACGQKHAADTLVGIPAVRFWSMQCHFHDLPIYSRLVYGTEKRQQHRRVLNEAASTRQSVQRPRFGRTGGTECRGRGVVLSPTRGSAE